MESSSLTPGRAEFLGAMTGDKRVFKQTHGYGFYRGYDQSKYKRYITSICLGADKEWGKRLSGIAFKEFGIRGSIYWDRDEWFLFTSSARLFRGLSPYYSPEWNARKWRISPAILDSSVAARRRFAVGYFDADGYPYFSKSQNRIFVQVNSVNKRGLEDFKRLLESLGYHPGLYRRYKHREVWQVVIQRKREIFRFTREIGFSISRKQSKLLRMIARKWPSDELIGSSEGRI
jgi:hypothetical protein